MDIFSKCDEYDMFEDDSLSEGGDNSTSSEDEIDIILHGTPEQHRKLQHCRERQQRERISGPGLKRGEKCLDDSSSEDEFEKEMNAELNQHVKVLEDSRGKLALKDNHPSGSSSSVQDKSTGQTVNKTRKEYYDEIYFDSDEEDEAKASKSSRKQKHAIISNDDLLYDPNMDDEDQKWVDQQRQSHRSFEIKQGGKTKMPNSDALLDCPACMTTLCIDCQRHETYKHQYRAMFVMNCKIDRSETLQCPVQTSKNKKKRKKTNPQTSDSSSQGDPSSTDLFNPVRCTECNTVAGVIDHDEVYHFFNVLASHT